MSRPPITTHVLDTALGQPAANMKISLAMLRDGVFDALCERRTNADGRLDEPLLSAPIDAGVYRITFHTEAYFSSQGKQGFYPIVEVMFTLDDPGSHYHVPLLISPYGYSTYRGS